MKIKYQLIIKNKIFFFLLVLTSIAIFIVVNLPEYKETSAYIISVKSKHEKVGIREYIKFSFIVDEELYEGTVKTWRNYKYKKQFIGNTLALRYSISNPNNNEFIKFNNEYNSEDDRIVLFNKDDGDVVLILINKIFEFKEYSQGRVVKNIKGQFSQKSDAFFLKPFLKNSFFVSYIDKNKNWVDVNDQGKFLTVVMN